MTNQADVFTLRGFTRFHLVFSAMVPLAFLGIMIGALSSPYMMLTEMGPIILLGLGVWAVWSFAKMAKWISFSVSMDADGITIKNRTWGWDQIRSARAKTAMDLDTFIELRTSGGQMLTIPAAVQQNGFVLAWSRSTFRRS